MDRKPFRSDGKFIDKIQNLLKKGKQKNSLKNINEVSENYFLFLNYFNNFE